VVPARLAESVPAMRDPREFGKQFARTERAISIGLVVVSVASGILVAVIIWAVIVLVNHFAR